MELWLAAGVGAGAAALNAAQVPALTSRTRLLLVAPHPDDETLAAGQLVQRVRQAGGMVRVLLLTDGGSNPWPQRWLERRIRIGAAERERWAERRRQELAAAVRVLGIPLHDVQSLGWQDMGIAPRMAVDGESMVQTLAASLAAFEPTIVVMPDTADRHPDHGAAHVLMRLALLRWGQPHQALCYVVHGRPPATNLRHAWRPDPGLQAAKRRALHCHGTQMALSGRRLGVYVEREEVFYPPASGAGAATHLPWNPLPALAPALRLMLAHPGGIDDWPLAHAPVERARDGLEVRADLMYPCFARLYSSLPSPWIYDRWGWLPLRGL